MDNRALNLHWATKEEQGSNTAASRGVISTCCETGEVNHYPTIAAAARAVGVPTSNIRSVLQTGCLCQGSIWADDVDGVAAVASEGPALGHPDVTVPIGIDFVRRLVWRAGAV